MGWKDRAQPVKSDFSSSNNWKDRAESIDETPSTIDDIINTAQDTALGLAQGVTLGGADELASGLRAAYDVATTDKKLSDLQDLYRQYQQLSEKKFKEAEERSPFAYGAGEFGGFIAPALVTGGSSSLLGLGGKVALKEAAGMGAGALGKEIAKRGAEDLVTGGILGGTQAGLSSEHALIGSSPEERAKLRSDIIGGAETGSILGGGISLAGNTLGLGAQKLANKAGNKARAIVEDSPFLRQVMKAKEFGERGIDIGSEAQKLGRQGSVEGALVKRDTEAAKGILDDIYKVDDALGKDIGDIIDSETTAGTKINIEKPLLETASDFMNYYTADATLAQNPKAKKLSKLIFQLQKNDVSPKEIQSLRQQIVDFADSVKLDYPSLAHIANEFQGQIGEALKNQIPAYRNAAQRFEEFRRLIPETIIAGEVPVNVAGTKFGSLKNQDATLFKSLKRMVQGSTRSGTSTTTEAETLVNLMDNLDKLKQSEAARVAKGTIKQPQLLGGVEPEQYIKKVKSAADESAMLQQAFGVNPQEGFATSVKRGALDLASTGRGTSMSFANKYGLYKDKVNPVAIGKKLYAASDNKLRDVGMKIASTPGFEHLGNALLKGLENKDAVVKNAAIFAIIQNPNARFILGSQDLDEPVSSEKSE